MLGKGKARSDVFARQASASLFPFFSTSSVRSKWTRLDVVKFTLSGPSGPMVCRRSCFELLSWS